MGNFLSDYTGIDIDFLNPQSYTNSSNPIAPLLLAAGLQTTGLGTGTSRPTGSVSYTHLTLPTNREV